MPLAPEAPVSSPHVMHKTYVLLALRRMRRHVGYTALIVLAFALAIPAAYLAAQRWLDAFACQIHLGPGFFLLAGATVALVALAAVRTQALKAARASPVDALRYE